MKFSMNGFDFEQSYASRQCNEYDITKNKEYIGYYVEHFVNPITKEKLDNTVFEMYYDYDGNDYNSSIIADSLDECLDELIN